MTRWAQSRTFQITPESFDQIDDWIRAAQASGRNIQYGVNVMLMFLARTNQAIAMEMSAGFVDPRMNNHAAAWKIPVRRITSRYYRGWKAQRIAPNVWIMFNTSREAYYIEYGIHPTGSVRTTREGNTFVMRVRRPIQKLSLTKTLRFVDQSRAGDRVWEGIFEPFRAGRHFKSRGEGIAISGMTEHMADMQARGV